MSKFFKGLKKGLEEPLELTEGEIPYGSEHQDNKINILLTFWRKLQNITQLTFHAKAQDESRWNGNGKGDVTTVKKDDHVLLFIEKGHWKGERAGGISFTNIFRWTLDRNAGIIFLEHLRHGSDQPVLLFHLTSSGDNSLSSVDPHLCGKDAYSGQIYFDRSGFRLNWKIVGPKKNAQIDYYYF